MIESLQRVISEIEKLPTDTQDAIAITKEFRKRIGQLPQAIQQ